MKAVGANKSIGMKKRMIKDANYENHDEYDDLDENKDEAVEG